MMVVEWGELGSFVEGFVEFLMGISNEVVKTGFVCRQFYAGS